MTEQSETGRNRRASPPILQNAFRPFFLGAASLLVVSIPLWVLAYLGWSEAPTTLNDHMHEMLFGYLPAIVCGFALTAIPNWTGRAPVMGRGLALLFALWAVGRLWVFGPENHVLFGLDLGFLMAIAGVAAREIMFGKNWRNLPILALLFLLAGAHFLFHWPEFQVYAQRATLTVATCLIALIGGRIIPSFTRNWLASTKGAALAGPMPSSMPAYDKPALVVLVVSLMAWVIWPQNQIVGCGLLLASVVHGIRLTRWKGLQTGSEPLVWSLHAGYLWLVLGVGLTGAGILWPDLIPYSAGIHALSAGMIGTMSLAVMTRVSLGHTGRARRAGPVSTTMYILVHLGAALRVFAALNANDPLWLGLGSVFWSLAFVLFLIVYAPMMFAPRFDAN